MSSDKAKLRRSIYFTLSFIMLIWLVKTTEYLFNFDFSEFGILPRTFHGSVGILTAPLVHGDIFHLISNTFPILILGVGLFYFYDKIAISVVILIYVITGFWVWIAARDAYHIGASGIVYGLLSFLLLSGFLRRDTKTLAISFIVLFLYGTTLFSGIFPTQPGVSWESHLMGAIAGIFCAVYFKGSQNAVSKEIEINESISEQVKYNYHYHYTEKQPENKPTTDSKLHYTYILGEKTSSEEKKD